MTRISIDSWEEEFCRICEKALDEEPLYPYEHLWKKGLSPQKAFMTYLEENPDYAEKLEEHGPARASEQEKDDFLRLAKELEQKKLQQKIESKMSKFCPECARVLGKKKVCKCGYRRPAKKKDHDLY